MALQTCREILALFPFPDIESEMLDRIEWMKQHPEIIRPEGLRGF